MPGWSASPSGAVNAAVNASVVADAVADASDLTAWGCAVLEAINDDGEDAVFIRRSLNEAADVGTGVGKRGAGAGAGKISANVPPGTRRSRLNSVATVEALVQERSIWSKPAAVATKFTGAAGKTVAEEMSEGSETCPSHQRPNAVDECDALLQARRRIRRAGGGKIRRGGNRRERRRPPVRARFENRWPRDRCWSTSGTPNDHRALSRPDSPGPKEAEMGCAGVAGGNTRSIDALRPLHGQSVSSVQMPADTAHPANPKSSTSGMRIAGTPRMRMSQSMGIRMQTVADGLRIEWAAPPTRVMNSRRLMGLTPKAKDHDLIITPRIAARSGHLCPLRVKSRPCRKLSEGKQKSEPGFWTKRFRGNERIDEAIPAPPCSSRARLRHRPRGSCR